MQNHAVVIDRVADTVNRRHRRHDHAVVALQQRLGGGQAHLLDVLVDAGVFFDKQIARRNVGFRLVIIVIRDKILDRVFREELAHLRVQLCCQRLVRCHDDGRTPEPGDDVGHGVGLARAGHAKQRLKRKTLLDAFHQFINGSGLVTGRQKWLMQTERTIGKSGNHG